MKKYLLFGGSGHAKVIADCIKTLGHEIVGIFDDNPKLKELNSIPFIGQYKPQKHLYPLVISIGDNRVRKRLSEKIKGVFFKIIHPTSIVSSSVEIDEGTVVLQGTIIQACTNIGKHCIINTGAQIDHDCVIDDFVHISPNCTICGNVTVGTGTHVGAAAVVIQGVKIGSWCVIGAGAVIINDVPDFSVIVGNPGKIIKSIKEL